MRTPSGVGAIEYRSDFVIERTQYAPKPIRVGTNANRSHVIPCETPMPIAIGRQHQTDGARADDVRGDEPADRDVHDRIRHLDGRLVAVDHARESAAHRLPEGGDPRGTCTRLSRAGRGIRQSATRGKPQDVGAHRLGIGGGQVLELDVRVGARADHFELRHPEQARDHGPREVDPLHAVERRTALRAEQDAAAHLDVIAGDPKRVEPPRHVEDPDQDQQDAEHDEQGDEGRGCGRRCNRSGRRSPPSSRSRPAGSRERATGGTGTAGDHADSTR